VSARPTFFATPQKLRAWFDKNHASPSELLVGFYKKGSGKPSITWPESVDEALSFGWIDGVRKSLDDERYAIRFTPRKPRSIWSAVNIRRAQELIAGGRMRPTGVSAFEARSADRSSIYAYEQRRDARLDPEFDRSFKANKAAWRYFGSRPPSYRRTAIYWVMSAKKDETRRNRLAALIADSARERTIRQLTPPAKRA